MLVDAITVRMVRNPQSLDTIVGTNLHVDILSDLVAALAGSIGAAPSSNLDPTRRNPSLFEPFTVVLLTLQVKVLQIQWQHSG